MKRLFAAALLTAGLALAPLSAQAGGYGHRYHHGHHGGAAAAVGIIGGALLLGSLLSAPRYYGPPAPVYYAPPRRPHCVRDRVYRYLPDGSVQWGVRTRCY